MKKGINIDNLWSMGDVDTGTDGTRWEQKVRQQFDISRWEK